MNAGPARPGTVRRNPRFCRERGTLSYEPGPDIFEAARERLPADEYVYVGDSLESDVRPAREAGFRPVHLDRTSEAGAVTVDGLATLGRTAEPL